MAAAPLTEALSAFLLTPGNLLLPTPQSESKAQIQSYTRILKQRKARINATNWDFSKTHFHKGIVTAAAAGREWSLLGLLALANILILLQMNRIKVN